MSKKGHTNQKTSNECPICESIIWGRGQRVIIEGARMTVCETCAHHGTKVVKKPISTHPIKDQSYSFPDKKIIKPKAKPPHSVPEPTEDIEIVSDYSIKIRNARGSKRLNQDQFAQKLNEKPSLIRRIESGKAKPTLQLAKKIEDIYHIKLLEKPDQIEVNTKKYMKKRGGSSLGDIAFIKKKK